MRQRDSSILQHRRPVGVDDRGFTLIEVMMTVVILGILTGLAVPIYSNFETSRVNGLASTDLRNAVTVIEQCRSQSGVYPPSLTIPTGPSSTSIPCGAASDGKIVMSTGDSLSYTYSSATGIYLVVVNALNATSYSGGNAAS